MAHSDLFGDVVVVVVGCIPVSLIVSLIGDGEGVGGIHGSAHSDVSVVVGGWRLNLLSSSLIGDGWRGGWRCV